MEVFKTPSTDGSFQNPFDGWKFSKHLRRMEVFKTPSADGSFRNTSGLPLSLSMHTLVIPANAGIHFAVGMKIKMDPGVRRDDDFVLFKFNGLPNG